ncbi:hypothetical protein MBLNU459_g6305t1 [Dothideomycetes sp. NU459]
MPPFIPRTRLRSPSPAKSPAKRTKSASASASASATAKAARQPKPTLFDALDAPKATSTPDEARAFLATLDGDDESSLSDISSDEFEDVAPAAKRRKLGPDALKDEGEDEDDDDVDEDDGMDWEDANPAVGPTTGAADEELEDLNISLNDDGSLVAEAAQAAAAAAKAKKGPSKRERQIRIRSHCIHVQALMFHNAVRNSWLNDKSLQKTLLDGLSEGVKKEIDRWKVDMGLKKPPESKNRKIRGKHAKTNAKDKAKRDGRDWGMDAGRLEAGVPNLSRGDPLLRLLKILTAYWRKRFTVTAPGLRKQGYKPIRRLADEIKAWTKDKHDFEEHGERVESLQEFKKLAKQCEGSRDVGAQLFTALIRGIGIEARMVANLQPIGFGWSKGEEAGPRKPKSSKPSKSIPKPSDQVVDISDDGSDSVQEVANPKSTPKKALQPEKPIRKSGRETQAEIRDQDDDSDSELSSVPSDDDASIIDITPVLNSKKPLKKYDRDLAFPHYWTEVLSPVSNNYIPVDSIVLSTVASTQELLSTFEPRGKRADQLKQVICYTIAHNSDGSAKDVTIRYLKKHQLPGRTKGFRMPVEKVPVHNKRGKVKKYEDYDWFKTVMSSYERPAPKRTAADDLEESTDLKPFKPVAEKPKTETESLQWYKQSADYVLERHLRREEAILPDAKPVRQFVTGKGDKVKEEPVYNRSDVVACKTVESWHKEGRAINTGEQPMKMVPVRAVTLIRKREMEDAERETGEKLKQGLYSIDQTDWIIPPPIENGVIPRNAFGSMDVYVPTMVPKGAIHIPLKGTAKICRKLNIDYAEACTGFEFGKQRAVPVLTGVVVAAENEDVVIDAWEVEEAEKRRKEDVKKEALVLHLWRKFVMGMRIVERMKAEYSGTKGEEVNPFVNRDKQKKTEDQYVEHRDAANDEAMAGGGFFLPGEEEEEEEEEEETSAHKSTIRSHNEDVDMDIGGGGFMVDDESTEEATQQKSFNRAPITPMSLQSAHQKLQQRNDENIESSEEEQERGSEEAEEPPRPLPPSQRKKIQPARSRAAAAAAAAATTKPKPKARTPKSRPKPKPAPTKTPSTKKRLAKRAIPKSEDDDDDDDHSSDLSSAPSEQDDEDDDVDDGEELRTASTSPIVIISPHKRRGSTRKKARTPVKSPYFSTAEEDGAEDGREDDNDDDDDEESEAEVVRARGTTARTRAKGHGRGQ